MLFSQSWLGQTSGHTQHLSEATFRIGTRSNLLFGANHVEFEGSLHCMGLPMPSASNIHGVPSTFMVRNRVEIYHHKNNAKGAEVAIWAASPRFAVSWIICSHTKSRLHIGAVA